MNNLSSKKGRRSGELGHPVTVGHQTQRLGRNHLNHSTARSLRSNTVYPLIDNHSSPLDAHAHTTANTADEHSHHHHHPNHPQAKRKQMSGPRNPFRNNAVNPGSRYLIVTCGFGVRRTARFTRTSRPAPANNARPMR